VALYLNYQQKRMGVHKAKTISDKNITKQCVAFEENELCMCPCDIYNKIGTKMCSEPFVGNHTHMRAQKTENEQK